MDRSSMTGQALAEFLVHSQQQPLGMIVTAGQGPASESTLDAVISNSNKAAVTGVGDEELQMVNGGRAPASQEVQLGPYNLVSLAGSKKIPGQSRRFFEPTMVVSATCRMSTHTYVVCWHADLSTTYRTCAQPAKPSNTFHMSAPVLLPHA